jgi:hypothetical protein
MKKKADDILNLQPTLDELLEFIHDDNQLPTPEIMLLWWMEENDDGTPDSPLSCLYRHLALLKS